MNTDTLACRTVTAELLDQLPPEHKQAQRARRDLRRINAFTGNAREMARALAQMPAGEQPLRLADIGGGDGTFLLHVARRMAGQWPRVRATIVDRRNLLTPRTIDQFAALGWETAVAQADIFAWVAGSETFDVITTNLFLHHFQDEQVARLLSGIAGRCRIFVACEPSRCKVALTAVRFLLLLGCGRVARYDARLSVLAGFAGGELGALWPAGTGWQLHETSGSAYSHSFSARRI